MGPRSRQERRRSLIQGLSEFRPYRRQYFNNDPDGWWHEGPLSVVGVSSGIASRGLLKGERKQLEQWKDEARTVLEIIGTPQEVSEHGVELLLDERSRECGIIRGALELERVALWDYNGDDVAEFLVLSERMDTSDECHPGSENTLGYGRYFPLKKTALGSAVLAIPSP